MKPGKEYEAIVAGIYRQFANGAVITEDEKIIGKSGVERQIDVSIRSVVMGMPILIIAECRDYNRRIDIKHVDGLIGVLEDVGAQAGFLVSNSGFSSGAFSRAERDGRIQLKSVFDAQNGNLRDVPIINFLIDYKDCRCDYKAVDEEGAEVRFDESEPGQVEDLVERALNDLLPARDLGVHNFTVRMGFTNGKSIKVDMTVNISGDLYYKKIGCMEGVGAVTHDSPDTTTITTKAGFATQAIDLNKVKSEWKKIPQNSMPSHYIMLEVFVHEAYQYDNHNLLRILIGPSEPKPENEFTIAI